MLTLNPIGYISTPFKTKADAPRQPNSEVATEGIIELLPGNNFEQALEDLEGIEKIWLIYWFHRNPNWKPKVLVPRGPRRKRGVFATRSPHRPNPIGLSLVDLISAKELTLRVRNVDLLDGTPILDIKPYLPAVEAHCTAKAGWIDEVEAANDQHHIYYSDLVIQQLEFLESQGIDLRERVERILKHDPTPHPYKRIVKTNDALVMAVRGWRVKFHIQASTVSVDEILSGYSDKAFENDNLSDDAAQRAFRLKFSK
jgi:tRNA-Thr(GGU) m(6)t(6)A37 methyltransferase TsaA